MCVCVLSGILDLSFYGGKSGWAIVYYSMNLGRLISVVRSCRPLVNTEIVCYLSVVNNNTETSNNFPHQVKRNPGIGPFHLVLYLYIIFNIYKTQVPQTEMVCL